MALMSAFGFDENTGTQTFDTTETIALDSVATGSPWGMGRHGTSGAAGRSFIGDIVPEGQPLGDFTYMMWVYINTLPGSGYTYLLANPGINATQKIYLSVHSNRKLNSYIGNGSGQDWYSTTLLSAGVWTHVAITYEMSSKNSHIYINGVAESGTKNHNGAWGSPITANSNWHVGHNLSGGNLFDGYIDELRIFDESLSESEIVEWMNTPIIPGIQLTGSASAVSSTGDALFELDKPTSLPLSGSASAVSSTGDLVVDISPAPTGRFLSGTTGTSSTDWLTDQYGDPWLMRGDSPWLMASRLTPTEAESYFELRASHGMNFVLMRVPAGTDNTDPTGYTGLTFDGIDPFIDDDVTQFNPEYWDERLLPMVQSAYAHGFTVCMFLATPWGFMERLRVAGLSVAQTFGVLVAEKFAAYPNVVYAIGEDYINTDWPTYDPTMTSIYNGVRSVLPDVPWITELHQRYNSTTNGNRDLSDHPTWASRSIANWCYSYQAAYRVMQIGWASDLGPTFLGESKYEGENNEGGPNNTNETFRRQLGWTLSSGGKGYIHGQRAGYLMASGWYNAIDTVVPVQMHHMYDAIEQTKWWLHRPDLTNQFLINGAGVAPATGTMNASGVGPLESNFATAALALDGSSAVIYLPNQRVITVDPTKLGENASLKIVDPTSGAATIYSGELSSPITSPGANSAGASDWLYIFTADPIVNVPSELVWTLAVDGVEGPVTLEFTTG